MKDEEGVRAGTGNRDQAVTPRLRRSGDSANNRHPSSLIPQTSSLSSWWRAILGPLLVLAGLATALLTLFARRIGDAQLASTAAMASLVFIVLIVLLVVPPLSRAAFAEISDSGFPVEVTTGGVIFVVILVIVAFAAWNTGNNLLFMVFSIMLSTLFVSWVAARAALRDLTVSARFPDHIFAGDPAEVIVTVRNAKLLLPSFSVLVEMRGTFDRPISLLKKRRQPRSRKITL